LGAKHFRTNRVSDACPTIRVLFIKTILDGVRESEKQKEDQKRMKKVGRVEIPQDAFLAALKVND
jgi:hypothetical protein